MQLPLVLNINQYVHHRERVDTPPPPYTADFD